MTHTPSSYLINFCTRSDSLISRPGEDQVYALCPDALLEALISEIFSGSGILRRKEEARAGAPERVIIESAERIWFFQKLAPEMDAECFPYFFGQNGKAEAPVFKKIVTDREAFPEMSERHLHGRPAAIEITAEEFFAALESACGKVKEGPRSRFC